MIKEILIACSVLLLGSSAYASVVPAPNTMHPSWDIDKDSVNDCEKDGTCDDSVDYSLPRGSDVVSYTDNFYRAVNREWLATEKINPEYGQTTNFTINIEKINGELRSIIDRLDKADKLTPDEQKIIDYYRSYVNVEYRNKLGITPLAKELKKVASAKTHEDIAIILAEFSKIGVSTPLDFDIEFDKKNSKKFTLYVKQSGIRLTKDKYLEKDERTLLEMQYYKEYLTGILTLAKQDNVAKMVDNVVKLETELAKIQLGILEIKDLRKVYNVSDFKRLNSLLGNLNMSQYLKINGVKQDVIFATEQEDYLKRLNELFVKTDVELWKSYLGAKYIEQYAPMTTPAFYDLALDYYRKLGLADTKASLLKDGLLVTNTSLGMLFAKLYIQENFDAKSKEKVTKMIEDIIEQYRMTISQSKLFSQETKERALKKLNKMTFNVGYPDKWDDYSTLKIDKNDLLGNTSRIIAYEQAKEMDMLDEPVDDTKWLGVSPQTVNAAYNANINKFIILAGILNKPFFDINASDAYNYGAIGMVIAHEIGHGFDDTGSRYDQDGNLNDWWEPEDRAKYNKRAESLIAQADHFEYLPGQHLNGKLEIGEIIGDLNGATIALGAYEKIIKEQGLDRKASLKEFFIQMAKVWRNKMVPHALEQMVHIDPHPVSEFRVNGVLKNVDTFHEIFEIKEGDNMYMAPDKRVKLW